VTEEVEEIWNSPKCSEKSKGFAAPLPVRQSRTTLPKGEGICTINGNWQADTRGRVSLQPEKREFETLCRVNAAQDNLRRVDIKY